MIGLSLPLGGDRSDAGTDIAFHTGEPIREAQKKELHQLIRPVVHDQEEIGKLVPYYQAGEKNGHDLTAEERAYIRATLC